MQQSSAKGNHNEGSGDCCSEEEEDVQMETCTTEVAVITPGDVVELVPGMESIIIVGTNPTHAKVTEIRGLDSEELRLGDSLKELVLRQVIRRGLVWVVPRIELGGEMR